MLPWLLATAIVLTTSANKPADKEHQKPSPPVHKAHSAPITSASKPADKEHQKPSPPVHKAHSAPITSASKPADKEHQKPSPPVHKAHSARLTHQSPVDMERVQVSWLKTPLVFSTGWREKPQAVTVVNNGEYVLLKFETPTPITISGGPLHSTTYTFQQMHWHWGTGMKGSEHELGGRRLPIELHLVFQAKSQSPPTAKTAVLAVLYESSPVDNNALYTATANTDKIVNYNDSYIETEKVFPLENYLPANLYPLLFYSGSLTTPPYTEGIQWIVFTDRSFVSKQQISKFREIHDPAGKNVTKDYRPLQKLERRVITLALGVPHDPELKRWNPEHGAQHVLQVPQGVVGPSRSYPYVVEVFARVQPVCGGAILHPRFVITACNCLASLNETGPAKPSGVPLKDYSFIAGTLHLRPTDLTVQARKPKQFYIHPQCEVLGAVRVLDIGAAEMERPFAVDETVYPVKLLSTDFLTFEKQFASLISQVPRSDCRVSGWDLTWNSSGARVKNDLESVRMIPLTYDTCVKLFRQAYPGQYVDFNFEQNKQLCATTEYSLAPFLGDFGDPLVCDGFLMGVISNYGPLQTHSKILPTVFQSISVMLDWIQKNNLFECSKDQLLQSFSKTTVCTPHRLNVPIVPLLVIAVFLS